MHLKQIAQGGTVGLQATAGFLRMGGVNHDAPAVTVPTLAPKPVYASWALNPADASAWTSVTLPGESGDPFGMSPHRSGQDHVRMPDAEFEDLLARAAEEGAKRALANVGLDGKEAALDIRDLRSLLEGIRFVRRTAVQSAVHLITTAIIFALLAGIALKVKIFGGGS